MPCSAPFVEDEANPERAFSPKARQDLALIQAALDGNANAYGELLRRYHKSVYHE